MTRYAMLLAALALASPAVGQDAPQPPVSPIADVPARSVLDLQTDPEQFDLARKKVVECEGEKFVFAWGAGAKPTRVTLCSKKDATPEELVQLIEHHAATFERTPGIPEDRRVAILEQMRAKIKDLKAAPEVAQEPATAAGAPIATGVTALPPLRPAATPAPGAAATTALPPKPRLSFACYTPGELGSGGPCVSLARDTRLTVKAGDPLAGGTSLRFVRNGESRGEVALAQMRKGQSVRLALPREVCSGVVEAETEILIVRGGRVLDSVGPYLLRC